MKGQLRIDHLYAWVCLDNDGTEGVPAFLGPPGIDGLQFPILIPLMGADMARMDSLRQMIRADPSMRGKKFTLCKYSVREELEVIDRRG